MIKTFYIAWRNDTLHVTTHCT